MKLKASYWITAGFLCVAGITMMIVGAVNARNNTDTLNFTETFASAESINIDLDNSKFILNISDNADEIEVDFRSVYEGAKAYIRDDTLYVRDSDDDAVFYFGFLEMTNSRKSEVAVTLPKKLYDRITLSGDAARNWEVNDMSCNELNVNIDAGSINLNNIDVSGKKTIIDMDAGSIKSSGCTFAQLDLDMDAGSAFFDRCEFGGVNSKMDAGSIKCTETILKGDFSLKMDAGSAKLDIAGDINDYNLSNNGDMCTMKVNGQKTSNMTSNSAKYDIKIDGDCGTVNISFE